MATPTHTAAAATTPATAAGFAHAAGVVRELARVPPEALPILEVKAHLAAAESAAPPRGRRGQRRVQIVAETATGAVAPSILEVDAQLLAAAAATAVAAAAVATATTVAAAAATSALGSPAGLGSPTCGP